MDEEEQLMTELGEEEVEESEESNSLGETENIPNNANGIKKALQEQPLGNSNEKIVLKKTASKKINIEKLVDEAIIELNERAGSSEKAIRKFIMQRNPDIIENRLKLQIKRYIKKCLTNGTMKQIKLSFKLITKKKKQIETKKQKIKEKVKLKEQNVKEKKKNEIKEREEAKVTKKKSSNEKLKVKTKRTIKSQEANITAAIKLDKIKKLKNVDVDVSAKTTSSKNMPKSKLKKQISRKSINLVVNPTSPRLQTIKKPKKTAAKPQNKVLPAAKKNLVAPTSSTHKATRRGKIIET